MTNMVESAKTEVLVLINNAYSSAVSKNLLPDGAAAGNVEIPKDSVNGDYSASFALGAAKALKMAPKAIADIILGELNLAGSFFERAETAGPGFINLFLGSKWYLEVLKGIDNDGSRYGESAFGGGRRVMVEFVSANPTGPMTIGNARGGVLGDTLSSVLKKSGYDAHREFYINDAGNQVELFGKSLEARYIQILKGEDACPFPENGYHGADINELAALYIERQGDSLLNRDSAERTAVLRKFGLEYNIARMRTDLLRYGIEYDNWFFESSLHESGYVDETVALLTENGLTFEKDGALWFKASELGCEKDEVLRRANGHYTYFASDIAYHRDKFFRRGFDTVIDVLGADHHGHALRFKAALDALGVPDSKSLDFLIMQMVRLTRGGETIKVSKRTGRAITLAELLDEIPVDAARFFFNAKPDTHLEFDMELAVRQDSENPVYYVKYAHARICSLISMLSAEGETVLPCAEISIDALGGDAEKELIKELAAYPEIISAAARNYDPSRVNRYLIELSAKFHRFYSACRIKGAESEALRARLKLADAARSVIKNGLDIIGIEAPEKM